MVHLIELSKINQTEMTKGKRKWFQSEMKKKFNIDEIFLFHFRPILIGVSLVWADLSFEALILSDSLLSPLRKLNSCEFKQPISCLN